MNRTLICSTLALAGVVAAASLVSAADEPSGPIADRPDTVQLASLDLHTDSRAYTVEYLTRDSDGDGWTDWYERLDGTDPYDPKSFPGGARVDVMDATVFVQSFSHPDRFIALDGIELPVAKDSFGELTDLIASITGTTSLGKFRDDLLKLVNDIGGDRIAGMLSDAAQHHDKEDLGLGGRTNGQLVGLISWDWNSSVGSSGASTTLTYGGNAMGATINEKGIATGVTNDYTVDGTGATFTEVRQNGKKVLTIQTEYVNGVVVGIYPTDASGKALPPYIAPVPTPPPTAPPAADPKPVDTAPAVTARTQRVTRA